MNTKPTSTIPHAKHKDMYRLRWDDGTVSVGTTEPKPWEPGGHYGFYNKTRALDILKNYDLYVANMDKPNPTWLNKRAFLKEK